MLKLYLQHTHTKEKLQVLGCQTQLQPMLTGSLVSFVCTFILCKTASLSQPRGCLPVHASSHNGSCVQDSCKALWLHFSWCIAKTDGATSCIQCLILTLHSAACTVSMHDGCPQQTDNRNAFAVSPRELAGEATSDSLYLDYNSVDVYLNVTINNKAWYPDLGSVASTNHNRLANILTGEGFPVVRMFQPALYALGSSPIPTMRVCALMSVSRYTKSLLQSTHLNSSFKFQWLCTGCLAGFLIPALA